MFRENILTKPSPPAVQNMFPLLEKSTLETSLLKSWIEQNAFPKINRPKFQTHKITSKNQKTTPQISQKNPLNSPKKPLT